MSHLVESYALLFGKASAVSAEQMSSIIMHHLLSVVEVAVHNNSLVPMSVGSISLEAAENIAGEYIVDVTTLKGLFIFPDDYKGTPSIIGNKSLYLSVINEAGIAYLPAGGGYSKRTVEQIYLLTQMEQIRSA